MIIQIKTVDIVEKLLDFNKQQKGRGIKLLTPRQIFQRLPIALAQLKAGNTFENLLNVIKQIMYSLYWEKQITKKVYNNTMNSKIVRHLILTDNYSIS